MALLIIVGAISAQSSGCVQRSLIGSIAELTQLGHLPNAPLFEFAVKTIPQFEHALRSALLWVMLFKAGGLPYKNYKRRLRQVWRKGDQSAKRDCGSGRENHQASFGK